MNNDLVTLLSDLISFKTVYPNLDEIEKCATYIKDYFKDSNVYIKEYEHNLAKSLVISNCDSKHFDVVFCGHFDVVPASDDLFTMKQKGDTLLGRGTSDMKGQDAVMMQVMKNYVAHNGTKKVALFLTSDEERGGFDGVNKLLNVEGYSCDVAIAPDGGFNYSLVVEEKGVLQLKLILNGLACHSSELWNGQNAITKLFDIFEKIVAKYPMPHNEQDWRTSVNLGKIEGGDSINKVPGLASMYIDIRHIHSDTPNDILAFIQGIDKTLKIEVLAQGDSFSVSKDDQYIKKYIDTCESVLGEKVDIVKYQAASDGRFFTTKGIPCIIMNPIGGKIHCQDEWVSLNSLAVLEKIYQAYLQ